MTKSDISGSYNLQIMETYFFLRLGMALLAFAFPLVLWLGGSWMGIHIRESLSAYYHTEMRDAFVGILFAIGLCLLLYKGFSRREDWLLNTAGVLAMAIALIPTVEDCMSTAPFEQLRKIHPYVNVETLNAQIRLTSAHFDRTFDWLLTNHLQLHGTFATAFCFAIGYVCARCSRETLSLVKEASPQAYIYYSWAYGLLGALLPGLAIVAAAITMLDPQSRVDCHNLTVYRVEFAIVWVFAAYWSLKTWEIHCYRSDYKLPNRRLARKAKLLG